MLGPVDLSLSEQARLVRSGDLAACELVQDSVDRIHSAPTAINAFTQILAQSAVLEAEHITAGDERPFAGVPIAVKDLFCPVGGVRQSQGSRFFADFVPPVDGIVVRRLRSAGFVIVGLTNACELGLLPVTEPRFTGPTRNPLNLSRTPGGSSGGAAAAVTAGLVPIAHGSDAGGSIRIPAACCGLVGLKPSKGLITGDPVPAVGTRVSEGVLARTATESAQLLDVLSDAGFPSQTEDSFTEAASRPSKPLRIAVCTTPPFEALPDPESVSSAALAAEALEGLGHSVTDRPGLFHAPTFLDTLASVSGGMLSASVAVGSKAAGRLPTRDDLEVLTYDLWEDGLAVSPAAFARAQEDLDEIGRSVAEAVRPFDVVVTPALGLRPLEIGTVNTDVGRQAFLDVGDFTPYTGIFNPSGLPALTLPVGVASDGLPLAAQLIGRHGQDGALLALARELSEYLGPWQIGSGS